MDYDKYEIAPEYDRSRQLPDQTMRQWLQAISDIIPIKEVSAIIDLGCGTGRFSSALGIHYNASVIGIDPSQKMLYQANIQNICRNIQFIQGHAEAIPCASDKTDLVFLSMVYHHIADRPKALAECQRILKPNKYLCIRNSVTDLLDQTVYLRYFPSAVIINKQRLLSKNDLITEITQNGFSLITNTVISQVFADTLSEYAEKVGQRTLSDLNFISDQEFAAGMRAMERDARTGGKNPIHEPIAMFVFQKK